VADPVHHSGSRILSANANHFGAAILSGIDDTPAGIIMVELGTFIELQDAENSQR
jgi:hypothetical protein